MLLNPKLTLPQVGPLQEFGFGGMTIIAYTFQVFLLQGHPTPPIATNWLRHRLDCAYGWESVYEARIKYFTEIISQDVAACETIELD